MNLYPLFKKVAFGMDAEKAHELSIGALSHFPDLLAAFYKGDVSSDRYTVNCGNLKWSFPVGLAAGLDKNAQAINFFSRIRFGAVEVGTVTPKGQEGNSKPRLFRYPDKESLRNRMGFNNAGSEEVYKNIIRSKRGHKVLGVNLGKNKITSADGAKDDYCTLYKRFSGISDYLVINVSSPNTKGLRDLQKRGHLSEIFESLKVLRKEKPCPLFVKISPDLDDEGVKDIVSLAKEFSLNGIIATNTTIVPELGEGGVSGRLLKEKAVRMRNLLLNETREHPELDIIGVGGIDSFKDLWDFWKAGGKVVQIYSSFIFQGPEILCDIQKGIDHALKKNNCTDVEELLSNIESMEI